MFLDEGLEVLVEVGVCVAEACGERVELVEQREDVGLDVLGAADGGGWARGELGELGA